MSLFQSSNDFAKVNIILQMRFKSLIELRINSHKIFKHELGFIVLQSKIEFIN